MSWSKSVFSKMADTIGYDSDRGELLVTWKDGRTSAYEGVDEETALQVANAGSVGQMIHNDIKPNYKHRYV